MLNTNPLNSMGPHGFVMTKQEEGDIEYLESGEVDIEICKFFEREETEEEAIKRKEDELKKAATAGKGAKKDAKPKKGEEEGPVILKEPMLSDIIYNQNQPYFSKWIGSILQAIKNRNIRDSYTGESILGKIYPKKDGMPVYNPSGRYWVKLYHQGRERKIEVDDLIPLDVYTFKFLFPCAEKTNQLWPLI